MAKHQLPKLWLRVRFPPLAPKDLSVFFCGGNLADFVLPSFLLVTPQHIAAGARLCGCVSGVFSPFRLRFPPLAPKDLSVFFCGGNLADFVCPSFLLVDPASGCGWHPSLRASPWSLHSVPTALSSHLLQKTEWSFY